MEASGYVSGPISDTLRARLAVKAVEGGAWQYSVSRPDEKLGDARQIFGRLLLDWEPTDRLRFAVNLNGWRDKSDTQAGQLLRIAPSATSPEPKRTELAALMAPSLYSGDNPRAADWTPGFEHDQNNSFYQGSVRGEYDLTDDVTLTSVTAYQKIKIDRLVDMDASRTIGLDNNLTGSIKNFSQELRLSGTSGPLTWIVGGNYDWTKSDDNIAFQISEATNNEPFFGLIPEFPSASARLRQTIKNYAVFANAEYALTDRLTFNGGVRYTDSKRSGTACTFDPSEDGNLYKVFNFLQEVFVGAGAKTTPVVTLGSGDCYALTAAPDVSPLVDGIPLALSEDNVSWRAGLNYKFDGGALLYGTVSRGYKSGVITNIAASAVAQFQPATQERVDAYEIGVKAPLADRRVQLNASAFYYDYRDKQIRGRVQDVLFGLLETLVNVPKSRIWGIEADVQAEPVEGLRLSAGGTYLNSKVTSDFVTYAQGASDPADLNNFRGSKLSYTPKYSATFDAQYTFPVNDQLKAYFGGGLTYRSRDSSSLETDANPYPDFRLNAYTLIDLRAGISGADESWRAEIFGRNITNKYYWNTVFQGIDEVHRYTGRPATYGVSFRYKFD